VRKIYLLADERADLIFDVLSSDVWMCNNGRSVEKYASVQFSRRPK